LPTARFRLSAAHSAGCPAAYFPFRAPQAVASPASPEEMTVALLQTISNQETKIMAVLDVIFH
jgi:hypothetical protein